MAKSGQIVASTAGTFVRGPALKEERGFMVTFPTTNTGTYGLIIDDPNLAASTDAASTDAYILEEGKQFVVPPYKPLSDYWFTGASNGDIFTYTPL